MKIKRAVIGVLFLGLLSVASGCHHFWNHHGGYRHHGHHGQYYTGHSYGHHPY